MPYRPLQMGPHILARIELALVKGFVGGLKTLAVWSPSNLTPFAFHLSPLSSL